MIIFDIDGTLSIVGDRIKYLNQEKKDWDSFYKACGEDKVNYQIVRLYVRLRDNSTDKVLCVTGRREEERQATLDWFKHYNIPLETGNLYMRANGDYRPDWQVKEELVAPFMHKIVMAFEDRKQVVDMWRRHGITCLQVADGNY
jgi:acid phosphatase class B